MESSGQNGTRTDHDRDATTNGASGANNAISQHAGPSSKDKAATTNNALNAPNGTRESRQDETSLGERPEAERNRMNDLPDEIIHITQGFVPLSLLLTRLAQTTHNAVQDKVAELAKMPLPATFANGNAPYSSSNSEDSSVENLRKKGSLSHFAQEWHGKWLKALVITEWSRKAHLVSKLIDLKFHIDQQRMLYDAALDNIVNVKRDLTFARMPSPDLKTALQILSSGTAPWMPDLQYIEPPALSAEDQSKWINDLNTLLSLRLNLDDFDKIPPQFRNYEISSGRVTFRVDGEFEVDLTIADEDFKKQFWFIDFRYAFAPAASRLPESLRAYLEGCVNDVLGREGLEGCYKYLHEFVLTSKINELRRQALQLSRSSWTGTLNVEPLNRALAIQYWTSRSATTVSKSWILVAVNGNRKANGKQNANSSSQLVVKWYRDGREVEDVDIELDLAQLSAESLLTNVIRLHVGYILGSIHERLSAAARFKNREAGMVLRLSKTHPAHSILTVQVGCSDKISMLLEPMTGVFAVKPQSKFTIQPEHQLNNGRNAPEDGVNCLEHIRCAMMEDELHRRSTTMGGWEVCKPAMTTEELKSVTKIREWTRAIWLRKAGWGSSWLVVVVLSLSGDEWWLLESNGGETMSSPRFRAKLPLDNGYPELSDTFWNDLGYLTTGLITQSVDLRELHRHRIKSRSSGKNVPSSTRRVRLPSIEVALSALFPAMVFDKDEAAPDLSLCSVNDEDEDGDMELLSLMERASGATLAPKKAWADNIVSICFNSVKALSKTGSTGEDGSQENSELMCDSVATIKVRKPAKFASLTGLADRDVTYDAQLGQFSMRIQRAVGKPVLDTLKSRIKAIDRFVNFLEAMECARSTITTESVTLRQITFYYSEKKAAGDAEGQTQDQSKRWRVVLDLSKDDIDVEIEKGNSHLRLVDLMRQLVNSDGGIGALMSWLPSSLAALEAIDKMETRWEPLLAAGRGGFEFSMKTIAWMTITYSINPAGSSSSSKGTAEVVTLEVQMKRRRNEAWWHVWRSDADADDAASQALKLAWNGKGEGWLGLATSAAGRPQRGVVAMLLAVDEAIRKCVTDDGKGDVALEQATRR
ncbi:uncharacterized protein UV8b_02655 [Ustilaginoidea virens]|uniref:Mediator of RNA polymerase II transcription subunit 14 n=1 Tax=Ustilaginoidea virens TaxID=1159556 RepID=A0A8E5HN54_USTVR|nr:uncharacterized protein UV8b_02655 [Ustilaginoidea virens]QUC18414.1 hypothetical protein UV8b_02655 [Ustilaginoidea virens]